MKNIFKFLIGSILAVVIIITSIMTALSILKDEAVDNYLTISKLNAKAYIEHVWLHWDICKYQE